MEAVAQRIIGRVGGSGEPMKGADVIAVIAGAMDLPPGARGGLDVSVADRLGLTASGTTL